MNDKIELNYLGCNTNIDKVEPIKSLKKGDTLEDTLEPLYNNRFLIHFPEEFEIDSWFVKSMRKTPKTFFKESENKLYVTIYEYLCYGDLKIIEKCELFNKLYLPSIIIDDLDKRGCVLNSEKYINCRIDQVDFKPCDYSDCKIKESILTIHYDDTEIIK